MLNLACAAWTYSTYLNLRERQLIFYMLLLGFGILEGFYNLMFEENGNLQILGKMINVAIYFVIMYFVCKSYS
jgi:hypothetical protein